MRFFRPRLSMMRSARYLSRQPSRREQIEGYAPGEYERHCADVLRALGWQAKLTGASGDQGADVIADKAGIRVALQCKLYNRPVGNSAVQEVFAAKILYGAREAAVVTPAGYTPGAKEIAKATRVLLLATAELSDADWLFGAPASRVLRNCPSCGQKMRLPGGRAGGVRCPACGHRFWTETEFR